jgi:tRNA A37 N6-isopentenylltransferase MiaA
MMMMMIIMWNMKAEVIPVIIGGTGTISNSLGQNLCNIPGKHEIKELKNNSHIGHCTHTLREVLTLKVQNECNI